MFRDTFPVDCIIFRRSFSTHRLFCLHCCGTPWTYCIQPDPNVRLFHVACVGQCYRNTTHSSIRIPCQEKPDASWLFL